MVIHLSASLSVCLSVCLSAFLTVFLSVWNSIILAEDQTLQILGLNSFLMVLSIFFAAACRG